MELYFLSAERYELIDLNKVDNEYIEKLSSKFCWLSRHSGLSINHIIKKVDAVKIIKEEFNSCKGKNKRIEGIKKFINDIPNDSHFLISNIEFSPINLFIYRSCIIYANEGKNPIMGFCYLVERIKMRDSLYDSFGYGYLDNQTIRIGERDRTKRICRFCGKARPDVDFLEKAHAISESIGNKKLICCEECDTCNGLFGDHEQHFASYMRIMNLLSNRKEWIGKGQIEGQIYDIKITYDNDRQIVEIINSSSNPSKSLVKDNKYLINLYEEKVPIILSKVYKSLIKYTLSVLPSKYLEYFANTIDWIKSDKKSKTELPFVYRVVGRQVNHPFLICHIRKNEDKEYPFCICELHCFNMIFIYIIPFSTNDDNNKLKDITEDKMKSLYLNTDVVKEDFNISEKYSISTDLLLNI